MPKNILYKGATFICDPEEGPFKGPDIRMAVYICPHCDGIHFEVMIDGLIGAYLVLEPKQAEELGAALQNPPPIDLKKLYKFPE